MSECCRIRKAASEALLPKRVEPGQPWAAMISSRRAMLRGVDRGLLRPGLLHLARIAAVLLLQFDHLGAVGLVGGQHRFQVRAHPGDGRGVRRGRGGRRGGVRRLGAEGRGQGQDGEERETGEGGAAVQADHDDGWGRRFLGADPGAESRPAREPMTSPAGLGGKTQTRAAWRGARSACPAPESPVRGARGRSAIRTRRGKRTVRRGCVHGPSRRRTRRTRSSRFPGARSGEVRGHGSGSARG